MHSYSPHNDDEPTATEPHHMMIMKPMTLCFVIYFLL